MEFDEETLLMFIEDAEENLRGIEDDLLALETAGRDRDDKLADKVFRAFHSVKGSAGYMALQNIRELAYAMEKTMNLICARKLAPGPEVIGVLLESAAILKEMTENPRSSDQSDTSRQLEKLEKYYSFRE
ncbi:Hpt domain-containing protein [bacterium]|nr:Hpt domain-containing protein [bacterium]